MKKTPIYGIKKKLKGIKNITQTAFFQFDFISVGVMFWMIFPWLNDWFFPNIESLEETGLQLYFNLMLNFFIVFVGLVGVIISILLGSFYLHYLGMKECAETDKMNLYWDKECNKIRKQFIIFVCFMSYSCIVFVFTVILPVINRMTGL